MWYFSNTNRLRILKVLADGWGAHCHSFRKFPWDLDDWNVSQNGLGFNGVRKLEFYQDETVLLLV